MPDCRISPLGRYTYGQRLEQETRRLQVRVVTHETREAFLELFTAKGRPGFRWCTALGHSKMYASVGFEREGKTRRWVLAT